MAPRSIGLDNKSDESKSQIYILELETHVALSCILAFFLACETLGYFSAFRSVLSSYTYLCVAVWPLV
jgi:predicted membrane chloride channel (bestrophin family)